MQIVGGFQPLSCTIPTSAPTEGLSRARFSHRDLVHFLLEGVWGGMGMGAGEGSSDSKTVIGRWEGE
jgi:hypothetical protein